MQIFEEILQLKKAKGEFRELISKACIVDFASNDYFGFAQMTSSGQTGSTGSRLLTGHHAFYEALEKKIAHFHQAENCLIFNSGYTANLGLISALGLAMPSFVYDMEVHASMIDGMRLANTSCLPFKHNNLGSLERRLKNTAGKIFVLVESLYSISGDLAPLQEIAELCKKYGAFLIVDEAHATGLFGQEYEVFARVHTFSKALGCHGACILCSDLLKDFLINYSRPFIYTTALPLSALYAIDNAYNKLSVEGAWHRERLNALIDYFRKKCSSSNDHSPIQPIYYENREVLKNHAIKLAEEGIDVRPILYPTTRKKKECLRIVLHSFNTENEIDRLFEVLK